METKRTSTVSKKNADRKKEGLAPKRKIRKSFPVYNKPRDETKAKIQARLLKCQLSLSSAILAQEAEAGKNLLESCAEKDALIVNLRDEMEIMRMIYVGDEEKDPYKEEVEKLRAENRELTRLLNIARNGCAVKDGEVKGFEDKECWVVEALRAQFRDDVEKLKAVCSKLAEETRVLRNECAKKDGEIKGLKGRETRVVEALEAEFKWKHRKLVKALDIARNKCAVKDGEIKGPKEGELGVVEEMRTEFREQMEKLKADCSRLAEETRVLRNECAVKDGEIKGPKEGELGVVEEMRTEFREQMEKLKADCSRLAEETRVLRNECAVKDGEMKGLKDRETMVVEALEAEFRGEIEKLKAECSRLTEESRVLRNECAVKDGKIEVLRADFRVQQKKIVRELAGSSIKCKELDGELAVFRRKCARLEAEIAELKVSHEKVSKEENANQRVPVFPVEDELEIFSTGAALEMGMEQERVQLVPEELADPIERESTLVIARSSCKLKRTRSIEDDENRVCGGSSIPKKRSKLALVDIETCEAGIKFSGCALRSYQSRYNLRSASRHKYNLRCRKSKLKPSK